MRTKTIGELLKDEREKNRLSIEALAEMTRIRAEYLIALEDNRFTDLPAATFVKGYIRTYSKIFGFDHEPLMALLRRDYKESAVGTLVPRDFIKPVFKNREIWTPITMALLLLTGIFVTLIGYVGVQWYNIQKPPRLVVTAPEENAFVSSKIEVKGETVGDAVVSVNAQPVAIQASGSFQTELYIPREGIHTISIEAVDRRGKRSTLQRSVHVRF
jgi:cytoskeletal protein RodZ